MAKKELDPIGIFLDVSEKNDYKYARETFEKLLLKDPLNTRLLFQLGNVHSIIGENPKKAIEVFSHVLKLDPKFNSARNNKAVCLMEIKDYKMAIKEFSVVLKTECNSLIFKQRGYCYEKLKEYKKAVSDLKESINLLETEQ